MKFLVTKYFKDEKGEWHPPGSLIDIEKEEASLYRSRDLITVYQTQMVKPPETRVVDIPSRRRKGNAP